MNKLMEWLKRQHDRIYDLERSDLYRLFLCAKDLDLTSHSLSQRWSEIESDPHLTDEEPDITVAFLRQITLIQYNSGERERAEFIRRQLTSERLQTIEVKTFHMIGLASEQRHLLSEVECSKVRSWLLHHSDIDLRTRAWTPRYLELCGHKDEARRRARALLAERSEGGDWPTQGDPAAIAAASYSLARADCVSRAELDPTADYLTRKLEDGIGSPGPPYAYNSIKFLHAQGRIDERQLASLRDYCSHERSIFLSYSRKDEEPARRLVEALRSADIDIWFDEEMVRPGTHLPTAVEQGIRRSRCFFLLVSSSSLQSRWVRMEHELASSSGACIVPVILEDVELPRCLTDWRCVDMRNDHTGGIAELLRIFDP